MGPERGFDRNDSGRRRVCGRRRVGRRHSNVDGKLGCQQGHRQAHSHLISHHGLQVHHTLWFEGF